MNFYKFKANRYAGENTIAKIVMLGLLLALALVLHVTTEKMKWPMLSFLSIDLSLVPIIIALFIFDFWAALALMLLRVSFQMILDMDEPVFWFGALIQLQVSFVFIFSITIFYQLLIKVIKANGIALGITLFISTIITSLFGTAMNWLWSTALYWKLLHYYDGSVAVDKFNDYYISNPWYGFGNWHIAVWSIFLPFNFVKFISISLISFPVIKMTYTYFTGQKMIMKPVKKTKNENVA